MAELIDSTEALIMGAPEQALSTRGLEAGNYHTRQDPRCRIYHTSQDLRCRIFHTRQEHRCKETPEIAAGWKILAGRVYMEPSSWYSVQELHCTTAHKHIDR